MLSLARVWVTYSQGENNNCNETIWVGAAWWHFPFYFCLILSVYISSLFLIYLLPFHPFHSVHHSRSTCFQVPPFLFLPKTCSFLPAFSVPSTHLPLPHAFFPSILPPSSLNATMFHPCVTHLSLLLSLYPSSNYYRSHTFLLLSSPPILSLSFLLA